MRETLIFPPAYELQMMYELRKCGLIKCCNKGASVSEADEMLRLFRYRGRAKQKIYQMFFLFNNIVLLAADDQNDYSGAEALGNFLPISVDEYGAAVEKLNLQECEKEYSLYLKPALLDELVAQMDDLYVLRNDKVSVRKFVNWAYDDTFQLETCFPEEYYCILEKNSELFQKSSVHEKTNELQYIDIVKHCVYSAFEDLSLQLDICYRQNACMVNSNYDLRKIGCNEFDATKYLSAYVIIKVECQKAIGSLPAFENIREVVQFKEKRQGDIRRLCTQLDELEDILRTDTRESAVKRAAENIEKASKELNTFSRNKEIISNWSTYLAIPIGLIEHFLSLPPIMGLSISIVGVSSEIIGKAIKARNDWIHIVR